MAGAYSDKPNNAPQWLPCESSQTTQECAGSNPPDPPCKAKFIQGRKLFRSFMKASGARVNLVLYLQIKN